MSKDNSIINNEIKSYLDNKFKNDFLKGKRFHEAFQDFTESIDTLKFDDKFINYKDNYLKDYFDNIIELNSADRTFLGTIITNRILIKKIVEYSKKIFDTNKIIKVADFTMGTGGFLIELSKQSIGSEYIGYEINQEIYNIGSKNLKLNNINGSFNKENFNSYGNKDIDLVIGNPPFGLRKNEKILDGILGRLRSNGFASLVISEGDFKSIQKYKNNDFYNTYTLKAIWKLPQKIFSPQTSVGAYVIFLEKTPQNSSIITYNFDIKGKILEESDFIDFDKLFSDNIDGSDFISLIKFNDFEKDDNGIIFNRSGNNISADIDIGRIIKEIQHSNKILYLNFSKLLGNLSLSMTLEVNTKASDIVSSIQASQKITSKKLYEILTAVTVSNFIILSGPSGVGKTSLVGKIAGELSGDFFKFPIKSTFVDESGLLGYWNPLLSKYEGTEVIDFIFRSSLGENKHIPFFLLLDEMNLSRIENYFSEFLSRIDEIKTTGAEIKLFDVLIDNESKLKNINYFIKKYNLEEGQVMFNRSDIHLEDIVTKDFKMIGDFVVEVKINLYSNFHIIGTINEDETTNSISNKVLDRAFYINLGVEDLFEEKETVDINHIINQIDISRLDKSNSNVKTPIELEKNIFEKIKEYGDVKQNVELLSDIHKSGRADILQKIDTVTAKIDIIYEIKHSKNLAKDGKKLLESYLENHYTNDYKLGILVINGFDGLQIENDIITVGYEIFDSFIELFFGHLFYFNNNNYQDITSKKIVSLNEVKNEFSKEHQDFINEINELLQEINKNDAIGYRSLQDMATFMKNYRENLNSFDSNSILDIVLCQKVWPKIKNYSIIGEKELKFEELKTKVSEYLGDKSESYKFLKGVNIF